MEDILNMRQHKLQRLYFPDQLDLDKNINMSNSNAHYLYIVMRKRAGDNITIFNSIDGEYKCEITYIDKKQVSIKTLEKISEPKKSLNIQLLYSPLKNVKSEYIVQKATELGVSKISPCIFKNTVNTKIKSERLEIIAVEATEQCERFDIPEVEALNDFNDIRDTLKDDNKIIIFCDETGQGAPFYDQAIEIKKKLTESTNIEIIVIVGPEGGFTNDEIDYIYSLKNSYGVGLGFRILRADTAIITALSLTQSYLGDFFELPDFRSDISE